MFGRHTFCLPVYNVYSFLEHCIKSINEQDMSGIKYEILCIDDYSTDDSYKRLEKLSKTNDRIRVLKNAKNYGVSYTRNQLIKEAIGKYIWFVDPMIWYKT